MRKKILMALILLTVPYAFAIDQKSIVDGTAQFLLDRAQQNYLYIFESRIKGNLLFKKNFEHTWSLLETVDLQNILTNEKLIRESIFQDFQNLGSTSERIFAEGFQSSLIDSLSKYSKWLEKNDSAYMGEARDRVSRIIESRSNSPSQEGSKRDPKLFLDSAKAVIDIFWDRRDSGGRKNKDFDAFLGQSESYILLLKTNIDRLNTVADTNISCTGRMSASLMIIKSVLWAKNPRLFKEPREYIKYRKQFRNFSSIGFFFAQISDANSSDQVKSILKAVTIPPVSFARKREDGHVSWTLNSYLGLAYGIEYPDKFPNYYGLIAPLGLEISLGLGLGGSISAMVTALDFGSAVNAQLYRKRTPELADLLSPGFVASYGIPHLPVVIGVQGSYGIDLHESTRGKAHVAVFVAMDLPWLIMEPSD